MAKQVHAEEIERFLGTVDGVASARLLTSPSGEIDQIYVTADDRTEARAARRAVIAALMTHYGIPIDPWRIQVTQLKRFSPSEIPNLNAVRVEEALAATGTTARVQVVWERAGEQRTGTGQAHGPVGAQHRLRTLAAAAIDAARAVVDPPHRRIAVQQVSLTTCMDRPLVLVGITAGGPRGQEVFVGSAFQREGTSDAPVAAALDAVTKWLLRAAFEGSDAGIHVDRRSRLEAMRHFARSGGRSRPDPLPSSAPARPASATSAAVLEPEPALPFPPPEPLEPAAASRGSTGVTAPRPAPDTSWPAESSRDWTVAPGGDDIVDDLREIRPEQKGGAAMAAHHEGARAGLTATPPARHTLEDEFLQPLIQSGTPAHIRCRDGYEIPHAIVREVGTYTLLVEADGAAELVYKHAIISIRPLGARA
jgi:sRNA-binding regulator protein Hfq